VIQPAYLTPTDKQKLKGRLLASRNLIRIRRLKVAG
jgi:hypothetical protein